MASDSLYLMCLILRGCLAPAELYVALQHTVTRLHIIGQHQLSRGEICVANFIPPANGARQGNYLLAKM